MANIIRTGGAGSGAGTLITKAITANGTYNATDDQADGYSQVTVNVPGGATGYEDISTFAFYYNKNTTTPTVTKISDYEYALTFTDQNSAGYELASFSCTLEKGFYIAEIKASINTNTGLAKQYTWGIYTSNTASGAKLNDNSPKDQAAIDTYVPFDTSDTAEHTYEVPIKLLADGTAYICFAMAADNGTNATVTVRSLKIRKAESTGETIPTLATHSGKLDLTDGTIAENPDYVYTDKFDLPSGTATMDFGNTYGTNAGIVWYDENDNYVNYFQANSRFRQMNMAQYYHAGYKARLGFPVASAYQIFIDNNAGKTMTNFDPTKIT